MENLKSENKCSQFLEKCVSKFDSKGDKENENNYIGLSDFISNSISEYIDNNTNIEADDIITYYLNLIVNNTKQGERGSTIYEPSPVGAMAK